MQSFCVTFFCILTVNKRLSPNLMADLDLKKKV